MMMMQVAKPEGFGNVVLEEVPIPECGPNDVLVKNKVSLISRGSEILRRYMHKEAIDPAIMGYSVGGVVAAVGEAADDISFEQAAFLPLVSGALTWSLVPGIQPDDTVVVLGQGLVGNLVMQAVRLHMLGRLITVDVIESRCRLSQSLGADLVINAKEDDPVTLVRTLTGGRGANVVIDCVGGQAGLTSFIQAQDMLADGGTLHLVGLYHGQPLPLDAGKIQRKRLIGGYYDVAARGVMLDRAIESLQRGRIQIEPLISHRFAFQQAKEAYDLLYERLAEAMGVLLIWD